MAKIFEVGPRDGLQSQDKILNVQQRARFVENLSYAGIEDIEVGSFVRADRIPQLTNTPELLKLLQPFKKQQRAKGKKLNYWCFVPNMIGLENALEHDIDGLAFFIATTESFCRKNVNRSQAELLKEIEAMLKVARKAKIQARVYVSTITYCPFEGAVPLKNTLKLVNQLVDLGAKDIGLGDTTGHTTPLEFNKLLGALTKKHSPKKFAAHLHDTRALALTNAWVAMDHGIERFDSSLGGLGGCPYAPGAAGNLATEDLAYMLAKSGKLTTKIDFKKLCDASMALEKDLGSSLPSKVLKTLKLEAQK